MLRSLTALISIALLSACAGGPPPLAGSNQRLPASINAPEQLGARLRFTCCNVFYAPPDTSTRGLASINDGNYRYPLILPAGTPVTINEIGRYQVLFTANGIEFDLRQRFGFSEPFARYLDKILPLEDPSRKIAAQPPEIAAMIREGKIALGFTREQVLLAIGHPPMHATKSLTDNTWTYWSGRFDKFELSFDQAGRVNGVRSKDPNVAFARFWVGPREN